LQNNYLFQHVKTLQFKNGTVIEAAKSIYNLVSVAKIENKDEIIKILKKCYFNIRENIASKTTHQ
jgi:hypothetical protein